ncbi:hypothetical protein BGZ83_011229 [Gryganskiella cystojenkinii]|nr:hypothetical protein BGZ83_011229 [Gryganskiella cystojenkinii]
MAPSSTTPEPTKRSHGDMVSSEPPTARKNYPIFEKSSEKRPRVGSPLHVNQTLFAMVAKAKQPSGATQTSPSPTIPSAVVSLPTMSSPSASMMEVSLPTTSLPVAPIPVTSLPVASLLVTSLPAASLPTISLPAASLLTAPLPATPLPAASPSQSTRTTETHQEVIPIVPAPSAKASTIPKKRSRSQTKSAPSSRAATPVRLATPASLEPGPPVEVEDEVTVKIESIPSTPHLHSTEYRLAPPLVHPPRKSPSIEVKDSPPRSPSVDIMTVDGEELHTVMARSSVGGRTSPDLAGPSLTPLELVRVGMTILDRLLSNPVCDNFVNQVPDTVTNYYRVIKKPMTLRTIETKLWKCIAIGGSSKIASDISEFSLRAALEHIHLSDLEGYKDFSQFERDLRRIYQNAISFNAVGDAVHKKAQAYRALYTGLVSAYKEGRLDPDPRVTKMPQELYSDSLINLSEPGQVYICRAQTHREMTKKMTDVSVEIYTNFHQPLIDASYEFGQITEEKPRFLRLYINKNRKALYKCRDELGAKLAIICDVAIKPFLKPAVVAEDGATVLQESENVFRISGRVLIGKPVGEGHDLITVGDLDCPSTWIQVACVRCMPLEADLAVGTGHEKGALIKMRHEVVPLVGAGSKFKPDLQKILLDALKLQLPSSQTASKQKSSPGSSSSAPTVPPLASTLHHTSTSSTPNPVTAALPTQDHSTFSLTTPVSTTIAPTIPESARLSPVSEQGSSLSQSVRNVPVSRPPSQRVPTQAVAPTIIDLDDINSDSDNSSASSSSSEPLTRKQKKPPVVADARYAESRPARGRPVGRPPLGRNKSNANRPLLSSNGSPLPGANSPSALAQQTLRPVFGVSPRPVTLQQTLEERLSGLPQPYLPRASIQFRPYRPERPPTVSTPYQQQLQSSLPGLQVIPKLGLFPQSRPGMPATGSPSTAAPPGGPQIRRLTMPMIPGSGSFGLPQKSHQSSQSRQSPSERDAGPSRSSSSLSDIADLADRVSSPRSRTAGASTPTGATGGFPGKKNLSGFIYRLATSSDSSSASSPLASTSSSYSNVTAPPAVPLSPTPPPPPLDLMEIDSEVIVPLSSGSSEQRPLTRRELQLLRDLKVIAHHKRIPYTRWDDIEPTLTVDTAFGLFKRIYHVEGDEGLVIQNFKEMDAESFEQRVREVACLLKLRGLEGVGQIQSVIDDEKDQLVGLSMTKYAYTLKAYATNATRRAPTPHQKLVLVRDMVAAISTIHAAGLAHRDLSEVNIMIDEDPQNKLADGSPKPLVRVIDFGKSVFVAREEVKRWSMLERVPEEELELLPLVILPPDHGYKLYRSILTLPKSKGDHALLPPVDPRAEDVYSLGVLIWRTFSGKSPWNGAIEDDIRTIRSMVATDHQIQFCINREVAGPYSRELLLKCLTASATTRFTAREVLDWLDQPQVLSELLKEFEVLGAGRKRVKKNLD